MEHILGYEINEDFEEALDLVLNQGRNLFITGSGGVGKSVFYEVLSFKLKMLRKNSVALAPTGVAAVRIGGQTIHKFFGLRPGPVASANDCSKLKDETFLDIVKHLDVLIIDEISMVRSDIFNLVDEILREVKNSPFPFGGVQVVIIGDLFQLGPIVSSKEEKDFLTYNFNGVYFFQTDGFRQGSFFCKEFTRCYRQKDQDFKDALNRVRLGKTDMSVLSWINNAIEPIKTFEDRIGKDFIHLVPTNALRETINKKKLYELSEKKLIYTAIVEGKVSIKDSIMDEELELKKGAKVMCLKNKYEGNSFLYQNGSIGTFLFEEYDRALDKTFLNVEIKDRVVKVEENEEEYYEYVFNKEDRSIQRTLIGKITQYPLTLAWARTIHKAQSATFEKVYVDLASPFFPPGLVYTALSRATDFEYLGLSSAVKNRHISIDPVINEFYETKFN